MIRAMNGATLSSRIGRAAPIPQGAWQGAWKRLFSVKSATASSVQSVRAATLQTPWRQTLARTNLRANATSQGAYAWTTPRRGFRSTAWRRSGANNGKPVEEKLSLGARLKKLSKEYGWTAVGVYLALSALDFPFCFLFVRVVGTETIGKFEHYIVSAVKSVIPESVRNKFNELWASLKKKETEKLGNDNISDTVEMAGWGVEKATEKNSEEASLATQLALAYAIHKSFIFIRVPLTAAILPSVVKVLRSWGWKVGKAAPRV